VSLLTFGPGEAVWEVFGHNALMIRNQLTGAEALYHWGVFSFDQPGFVPRFLKGEMLYSMGAGQPGYALEQYERANRSIRIQTLNMSPDAKLALYQEVAENLENPDYRYDYFLENCSTRIRDLIDRAVGGALHAQASAPDHDYRFHTRRLTQHDLPVWTGMDALLGNPGSRPITGWEAAFVPMELAEEVAATQVAIGGRREPLAARDEVLFASTNPPEPQEPRSFLLGFVALGLGLGGVIYGLGRASAQGGAAFRLGFTVLAGSWSLLAGLFGVLLIAVLFTDHIWMYRNENVLQLSPVSLILAGLLPLALLRARPSPLALKLAGVVLGLSVLGFVLQALPGLDQGNGEVIALALPIHWGTYLALRRQARPSVAP